MDYKLIGPGFAAEISGIDLSAGLTDADYEEIQRIWFEHKAVVFRDQRLSNEDLKRFAAHYGEVFIHIRAQFHEEGHPEITLVSNLKKDGKALGVLGNYGINWHCDQIYRAEPAFSTILYGVEIPAVGGNTMVSDLSRAYEEMPGALKARIDGRRAVYSIAKVTEIRDYETTADQKAQSPDVSHPLVRRHPYTGRPALFLSPDHLVRIEGIDENDQAALKEELVEWASQPQFTYEHVWRQNDLLMWDNTCTMHRRSGFAATERRILKRTGFMLPADRAVPQPAAA